VSKYRKPFISELKRHWAQRFPLWRPGICAPVFWAKEDGTFTDDSALASTGFVFHAVIDFTPKWPGAFTCDVVITPSLESLGDNPPRRWPDDVVSLRIGSYRIGWFVAGRDIWWRLVDDAAESRKVYEEILGGDVAAFGIERQPDHWYAMSYDGGLRQVIGEAVQDFSDTFERHVIPKLHRKT
jgi:hypothetical protein